MTNVPTGAAISLALIEKIAGKKLTKAQAANANSVVVALQQYGERVGLGQPHRLAQYLAQLLHESGAFVYDREVWGPTAQQKKYDTGALAKKLGNTPEADGDGFLFRGRTGIQITGRANTRAFRDWCRKLMSGMVLAAPGSAALPVPDFEKTPDAMLTDPWEGLGPIWYWDTNGLNRYADQGDIEMVTKRINGGLNGYQDRLDWYARAALVLLGLGPNDVAAFQRRAGEKADGIAGPRTRAALHLALVAMAGATAQSADVQAAPVVEEREVEKPTVPVAVEEKARRTTGLWQKLTGVFGAGGIGVSLLSADWKVVAVVIGGAVVLLVIVTLFGRQIVAGVRDVRAAVEG